MTSCRVQIKELHETVVAMCSEIVVERNKMKGSVFWVIFTEKFFHLQLAFHWKSQMPLMVKM